MPDCVGRPDGVSNGKASVVVLLLGLPWLNTNLQSREWPYSPSCWSAGPRTSAILLACCDAEGSPAAVAGMTSCDLILTEVSAAKLASNAGPTLIKGFAYRAEAPHGVYFAACHDHGGVREAWIAVILGTFGENDCDDHCQTCPLRLLL